MSNYNLDDYYVICRKHDQLFCILVTYVYGLEAAKDFCKKDPECFYQKVKTS